MTRFTKGATQVASAAMPVTQPRATIIIVNYNSADDLLRCLNSLQADPCSADYELLVVDNASTDGSRQQIASRFPGITLLHSDTNLGFGGANNLAASHARGDYIAFLNPDTIVEPGWLESLLRALEANPRAGLATSKILLLDDPQRINTAGNDMHLTGLTLCRGMGQPATELSQPARVSAISGAAFAMRRNLFQQLGGFDADFFMYFEDTDLSLRARLAGYDCLYVPHSIVYHDYELRFGPHKTYYEERNRYLMLLKIYRWRTLLLLLPALLLAEVVTWGYVLLRDRPRWRNKLHAYAHIIRHRRAITAHRQQVQATRKLSDGHLLRNTTHRIAFEQTGDGLIAQMAHLIFDPAFYLARHFVLFFSQRRAI